MPAHSLSSPKHLLNCVPRGRWPLQSPCHQHTASESHKPGQHTPRARASCSFPVTSLASMLRGMPSEGSWAPWPPSPSPHKVSLLARPRLRIRISILDILIHSDQHARADHPSVLGKLAFKLRYFREVNHPRASQHCLQPFLMEGRQGILACMLLSSQGGATLPGSPRLSTAAQKGCPQTPNTHEGISPCLNRDL